LDFKNYRVMHAPATS